MRLASFASLLRDSHDRTVNLFYSVCYKNMGEGWYLPGGSHFFSTNVIYS